MSTPLAAQEPTNLPLSLGSDEVDPELISLPDPPKRERRVIVLVLLMTALASLAMVFAMRGDVAYAFAPSSMTDVGDLSSPAVPLAENQYISGHAQLGAAGAIRFERPFLSDSFRLAPVAGHPNVWVEVRVPEGTEGGRYVPPSTFSGRLVHFAGGGPKHRGLDRAVETVTDERVPAGAWLLVDGEAPADTRWAVALSMLFVAFFAWNLFAAGKLVKRVKG